MIKLNEKRNSEIIVNSIINKIISLSITQSRNIKIKNKIPEACFSYIEESINNFISFYYIFYDRDEERNIYEKKIFNSDIEEIENNKINEVNELEISSDKNKSFLNNIFYNNSYYSNENNWDLMDEPTSSSFDRYATTLIKFEEKDLGIASKYKINQEKIIEEDENNYEENKNRQDIRKRTNKLKSTFINLYRKSKIFNNEEKNKNRKKTELNQLKTVDLEPEKNYENRQITRLRAIFEKQEKEREKEELINKQAREKLRFKMQLEESNLRKYAGKKINRDHNGEIIFIKSINPDKFKKEFIFTNSKSKMVTINVNNNLKPKINEKEDLKDIPIEKKEEIDKKERTFRMERLKTKRLKIRNKNDANNKEIEPIALKKNIPIITSGSNFHLMNMEVGVSIKEDEKYKTGGLDFFTRYNKFSIEVYNKKLKESENSINVMKNIEILNEPKTKTIEEIHNLYKTNYTLGNSTFDGNNSINLNTDSNIFNKKNNNNMMYLTNSNNSSLFKNYVAQANISTYKQKNILNLTPVINTKLGATSLINSFEKLNLISRGEKNLNTNNKNLFRAKMVKKANKYILDDMNTFTKNLLLNQKDNKFNEKLMMKTTGKIRGVSNPGKPNIREIIQEVGLKGKNMRARTKFPPVIKSNFLDNENFFKH